VCPARQQGRGDAVTQSLLTTYNHVACAVLVPSPLLPRHTVACLSPQMSLTLPTPMGQSTLAHLPFMSIGVEFTPAKRYHFRIIINPTQPFYLFVSYLCIYFCISHIIHMIGHNVHSSGGGHIDEH